MIIGFTNQPFGLTGLLGQTSLGAAVGIIVPVCYVEGSRILTENGYVAVEDLRPGDVAITATGEAETVRWVGQRQLSAAAMKRPSLSMPVRIKAHAFGENQPQRDLLVSPAHIVAVDGVVLTAFFLINGATIVQEVCDSVNYFHIECDRHVLVMAENVPSESYLDQGGRSFFANADTVALRPDMPASEAAALGLPASTRKTTMAIRRRLRERAETMGFTAHQFIEPAWAA